MSINPQIDTIYKKSSSSVGALVLHGFTGTPDSVRPVVNQLHKNDVTVLAPLLAGHGTSPEACNQTTWKDWYETAEQGLLKLSRSCDQIFVVGISLGGLLTLKLCQDYPQKIKAAAGLATALNLPYGAEPLVYLLRHSPLRWIKKYQRKTDIDVKNPLAKKNIWNYDRMPISCIESIIELQNIVNLDLGKIKLPLLLIHARQDSTVPYRSMNQIYQNVSSKIKEMITLENSYHIITMDYEKDFVAEKVTDFFLRFA